jgi:acyl carrier protein
VRDERGIREIFVDGLVAGAVQQINDAATRKAWLDGTRDLRFDELAMDSLARMELCIAIEIGTGVSMAPEELGRYASLGELAAAVRERIDA